LEVRGWGAIMIKAPAKKKKAKKHAVSTSHLDYLWRLAVRAKWGGRCAFCGSDDVECHHIVKRRRPLLRWDVTNGICLCPTHHVYAASKQGERDVAAKIGPDYDYLCLKEQLIYKDFLLAQGLTDNEFRTMQADALKEMIG
jgi:hypothetical protein